MTFEENEQIAGRRSGPFLLPIANCRLPIG
jgi:hypothetical protein